LGAREPVKKVGLFIKEGVYTDGVLRGQGDYVPFHRRKLMEKSHFWNGDGAREGEASVDDALFELMWGWSVRGVKGSEGKVGERAELVKGAVKVLHATLRSREVANPKATGFGGKKVRGAAMFRKGGRAVAMAMRWRGKQLWGAKDLPQASAASLPKHSSCKGGVLPSLLGMPAFAKIYQVRFHRFGAFYSCALLHECFLKAFELGNRGL
jgi:hypothetical protein